jgi:pilus assembly protein Flp/PilA
VEPLTQSIEALGGEVFGVLARGIPARLVEISRSGCLLESSHRVGDGIVGELRLEVGGELLVDDVRVTRCVLVEGSGSSYLVGAEFVQTRRPGERSIRRAVTGILRGLTEPDKAPPAKKLSKNGGRAKAITATPVVNAVSTGEGVMKELLARFVREDEGQDLIEYGLLAGLITAGVVGIVIGVGGKVTILFNSLKAATDLIK